MVLIATADGAMAQRHRIAILTARNVYNFDNVSNNLFLSGNTLRGQFRLLSPPRGRPFVLLPLRTPLRVPRLIAKFAPAGEITHTSGAHPQPCNNVDNSSSGERRGTDCCDVTFDEGSKYRFR